MNVDKKLLADVTSGLVGKVPWSVSLGHGSFLTLEFGARVTKEGAREGETEVYGEWHLWLKMCHWRIESPKEVLTGSDDDREIIEKMLNSDKWGAIREVAITYPPLDLTLSFESGLRIHTFSSYTNGNDQWILFSPGDMALTAYGGGSYQYGPSGSY